MITSLINNLESILIQYIFRTHSFDTFWNYLVIIFIFINLQQVIYETKSISIILMSILQSNASIDSP